MTAFLGLEAVAGDQACAAKGVADGVQELQLQDTRDVLLACTQPGHLIWTKFTPDMALDTGSDGVCLRVRAGGCMRRSAMR